MKIFLKNFVIFLLILICTPNVFALIFAFLYQRLPYQQYAQRDIVYVYQDCSPPQAGVSLERFLNYEKSKGQKIIEKNGGRSVLMEKRYGVFGFRVKLEHNSQKWCTQ